MLFCREAVPSVVRRSTVAVFLYHQHQRFRNFDSVFPIDVFRVKFYVDSLCYPTRVPVWVAINKLNLVPQRIMAGLVSWACSGTA